MEVMDGKLGNPSRDLEGAHQIPPEVVAGIRSALVEDLSSGPYELMADGEENSLKKAIEGRSREIFEEVEAEWEALAQTKSRRDAARTGLGRLAYSNLLTGRNFAMRAAGLACGFSTAFVLNSLEARVFSQAGLFFIALSAVALLVLRGLSVKPQVKRQIAMTFNLIAGVGAALALAGFLTNVLDYSALNGSAWRTTMVVFSSLSTAASIVSGFARELERRLYLLTDELDDARKYLDVKLRKAIHGRLRKQLNLNRERSYSLKLEYDDPSGLAEMDDEGIEAISTSTREELIDTMRQMPGGTIGLSGSRGAGKTTLMRSICSTEKIRQKSQEPLGVMVDAPVSYDPRDFVLYLFAQLCTQIIGSEQVREMRGSDNPFGIAPISTMTVLTSFGWLLGLGSLLAGIALLGLAALDAIDALGSPFAWGVVLIFVGYLSISVRLLQERSRSRHLNGSGIPNLDASDPNVSTAVRHLRQIWFQQSFSSGWSGGFKTPLGLDAQLQGTTQLAEQQLSLPDVVDLFRGFLKKVALSREVRIGIDELDKMDEETARRFLNEIKAIFRIPDCFFFVSISEDAMSFFERRGLPIRDVFDSTFDEVIHVPNLQYGVSRELLDRRIVGLPIPFVCYLHCVSGGLPRDLIRATRSLVRLGRGIPLDEAATQLLRKSLRSKAHAAQVAARSFKDDDHATVLNSWLDEIKDVPMTSTDLLAVCTSFDSRFLQKIRDLRGEDVLPNGRRELQALGTQHVAFVYYAANVLEFLDSLKGRGEIEAAVKPSIDPLDARPPVDRLATVSQVFSADVNSAWALLSRFRETEGMGSAIAFPQLDLVAT